ncbi:MAG: carbon-nitrogen hydrolase family protein [Deltaproteobacteria bacterium]|nr:carbon-nitrogen hydrolase family protein [Deltaproteobacteria bacterium]
MAQLKPETSSTSKTLDKLADAAAEARQAGASVLATGETFVPGYPAWIDNCPGAYLWDSEPTKAVFAHYRQQSVEVPGPVTDRLAAIARDARLVLIVGISERVRSGPGNRTLYNTLLTFDADGRLANHHRKLVPTYTERTIWGPGDARGLRAVDTEIGRVGGLVCWEHWMPLARQALHDSGELVHAAVWPTVHDNHQLASRHYALEGRCFVLAVGQIGCKKDLPADLLPADSNSHSDGDSLTLRGGSAVIAPDGSYVAEPVYDQEALIVAEIDPSAVDREAMTLDVSGHYSRPDIFRFKIQRD